MCKSAMCKILQKNVQKFVLTVFHDWAVKKVLNFREKGRNNQQLILYQQNTVL